ncbi:MAG: hypothetical protein MJ121_01450 [Clostridia bacterium]|nr:hypothetical protein [Clostridia bacterium]
MNKNLLKITSIFFALTILLTSMSACGADKPDATTTAAETTTALITEATETTTEKETTTEAATETTTEKQTEATTQAESTTKKAATSREELDRVLADKGFGQQANKLIIASYEAASENYNTFKSIFYTAGMPEKEEFLNEYVGTIRDHIKSFKILSARELGGYAYLGVYYPETHSLEVLDDQDWDSKVCTTFHEIIHSTHEGYFRTLQNKPGLLKVFAEGESAFWELIPNMGIVTTDRTVTSLLTVDGTSSYPFYSNLYEKILTIVGKSTIDKFKKSGDTQIIINALNNKGINGTAFLNNISNAANTFLAQGENLSALNTNTLKSIEASYSSYMLKLADNMSGKESTLTFLDFYYVHKSSFTISLFNALGTGLFDTGAGSKNYDKIDAKLYNNLVNYVGLPSSVAACIVGTLTHPSNKLSSMRNMSYRTEGRYVYLRYNGQVARVPKNGGLTYYTPANNYKQDFLNGFIRIA